MSRLDSTIHHFTEKMSGLLDLEREAELEESAALLSRFSVKELEKRDLAITKLYVKEVSTGIYGKILVSLERRYQTKKTAAADGGGDEEVESRTRKFSPGDIVGLIQGSQATETSDRIDGIVYRTRDNEIIVAYKEMYDFEDMKQPMSLVLLANEITHKRCKEAIDSLKSY